MSTFTDSATGARMIAGPGWPTRLLTVVAAWWEAYRRRRQRSHAAAHLRSWSDRELKDIGISRGQIELAVRGRDVRGEYSGGMP